VHGTVAFSQAVVGGAVTVKGRIAGLDADAKHGFHVHALGNLSGGCASAGPHWNPLGATHGARADTVRHAGDLGNILADAHGVAEFEFEDVVLSLNGPLSIIGRTLMVHAGQDDLGRGGDDESKKTGNAGGRAACGVIGRRTRLSCSSSAHSLSRRGGAGVGTRGVRCSRMHMCFIKSKALKRGRRCRNHH
jgi:Cu-Zn family superoxide dismutase